MHYLDQLKELLERYNQDEIAKELGVSVRSVQLYLTKENPTKPQKEKQRKISEIYTKLIKGKPVADQVNQDTPIAPIRDYRDEYIALLKKNLSEEEETKKALFKKIEGFEQMIADFKKSHETIASNFTEAGNVIDEVRRAQVIMYALQNAYYEHWLSSLSDREDVWQTIVERAALYLRLIQQKGIQVDLGMFHNDS
jgi:transcriptional regulator with XRE-family HTH domain